MICDKGLELDACMTSTGYSPLTYASALNFHEIVNYLTLRGCRVDQEDPTQVTPFGRYVLYNNFDLASKLLRRGANIDYCNRSGKTVLVQAVE
jgi:ankyrin repeat protein